MKTSCWLLQSYHHLLSNTPSLGSVSTHSRTTSGSTMDVSQQVEIIVININFYLWCFRDWISLHHHECVHVLLPPHHWPLHDLHDSQLSHHHLPGHVSIIRSKCHLILKILWALRLCAGDLILCHVSLLHGAGILVRPPHLGDPRHFIRHSSETRKRIV